MIREISGVFGWRFVSLQH